MARIRIQLEDEKGQTLTNGVELLYQLSGPCNTLASIEQAIEEWRKKALPDMEKTLLTNAQKEAIAKKKSL